MGDASGEINGRSRRPTCYPQGPRLQTLWFYGQLTHRQLPVLSRTYRPAVIQGAWLRPNHGDIHSALPRRALCFPLTPRFCLQLEGLLSDGSVETHLCGPCSTHAPWSHRCSDGGVTDPGAPDDRTLAFNFLDVAATPSANTKHLPSTRGESPFRTRLPAIVIPRVLY